MNPALDHPAYDAMEAAAFQAFRTSAKRPAEVEERINLRLQAAFNYAMASEMAAGTTLDHRHVAVALALGIDALLHNAFNGMRENFDEAAARHVIDTVLSAVIKAHAEIRAGHNPGKDVIIGTTKLFEGGRA